MLDNIRLGYINNKTTNSPIINTVLAGPTNLSANFTTDSIEQYVGYDTKNIDWLDEIYYRNYSTESC